ncbi:hypothetical protein [Cerasicoccus frondis]|uniref:hypothetical protein n=1 Tax=Cerasicoccus frondis TaxID=490090 RepID=UPI00285264F4|nr:hypothetical protein [Cerasicoccus frondis]
MSACPSEHRRMDARHNGAPAFRWADHFTFEKIGAVGAHLSCAADWRRGGCLFFDISI